MARMIPSSLAPGCSSPGEHAVFAKLRNDPSTSGWIVLHSFGVAKHPTRLEGEIDFVVLVPGEGILFLEIKAGHVSRSNGIWKYGTGAAQKTSEIGPFRQASEAMHAIRGNLARRAPDLRGLLFYSGVIFTLVDFDQDSPEWHSWQYAGRTDFSRQPISTLCVRMLRRAHDHMRASPSATWYGIHRSRPSREQVSRIAELLRPDFEYVVPAEARVAEGEQRIHRFTQEQFGALDLLRDNDRIIFKGPAGTGKTFLALEAAERFLWSEERVMVACYNKLLGGWLNSELRARTGRTKFAGQVTSGTLHSILLKLSRMTINGSESSEFWARTLPERVVDLALAGEIETPLFDVIVLDETQDLALDPYLDVLDILLEGGLAGGRWAFFGDFERQAIYTEDAVNAGESLIDRIRSRAPIHTVYPLRTNCRNSENIAIAIELACRLQPRYSGVLSVEAGPELVIRFYRDAAEQLPLLEGAIADARQRFGSPRIRILSVREDGSSCAARLARHSPSLNLNPLRTGNATSDTVAFSTIHAFKGLEAPAVVITDIEEFGGARMEALLYVGMSRAKLHLCVLMHERCKVGYEEAVKQGFRDMGRLRGHGHT